MTAYLTGRRTVPARRSSWTPVALARPALALAGMLAMLACSRPGTVGRGTGTATMRSGIGPSAEWTGACTYDRLTRWQSSLRHVVRLVRATDDHAFEVAFRRRPLPGQSVVTSDARAAEDAGLRVWWREGGTIRARAVGDLEVRELANGFVLTADMALLPQGSHRDTLHITAHCRIMFD